jgi:putative FmdB family regulatory protein
MPIYDYRCKDCGHTEKDYYVRPGVAAPERITCSMCGEGASKQMPSPAKTPGLWGDSAGYFDRGLGTFVQSEQHRQSVMKEKGLRQVEPEEFHRTHNSEGDE